MHETAHPCFAKQMKTLSTTKATSVVSGLLIASIFPQTTTLPYHYPSMQQSTTLSNSFYDLAFWGIDAGTNAIFGKHETEKPLSSKLLSGTVRYGAGLAFAKYGSELPVCFGVWSHEEYHRAVLGVNGVDSKNGNWLLSRWDGTVYGVSDESLADLKKTT
jgi:hypothetical protein